MVAEQTFEEAPFYGLGMGADISSDFHAVFDNLTHVDIDANLARYPHNVLFTVLGRMGIIGLAIFIPLCIIIARELFLGFRTIRRKGRDIDPGLGFAWAFVLAGFTNAFFQSTFEAPYSAVMFWTLLAVLVALNQVEYSQRTVKEAKGARSSDMDVPHERLMPTTG